MLESFVIYIFYEVSETEGFASSVTQLITMIGTGFTAIDVLFQFSHNQRPDFSGHWSALPQF